MVCSSNCLALVYPHGGSVEEEFWPLFPAPELLACIDNPLAFPRSFTTVTKQYLLGNVYIYRGRGVRGNKGGLLVIRM